MIIFTDLQNISGMFQESHCLCVFMMAMVSLVLHLHVDLSYVINFIPKWFECHLWTLNGLTEVTVF